MAKKENEQIWLSKSHRCPICGKEFFPGPEWVYKNIEGIYCTWTCMRKHEKTLKEQLKKYRYKPVEQLDMDGNVVAEYPCAYDANAEIDGTLQNLRYACLKNLKYKGYTWRYKETTDESEEKSDDDSTKVD